MTDRNPARLAAWSRPASGAEEDDRRSNLRRLDDLLDALETLNLRDAPTLTAGLKERLDELGIRSAGAGAPFAKLIDGVLAVQEAFMIHRPVDKRRSPRRPPLDLTTLRLP